ncbi:MAG: glycosyltransferase [Lachnospiraceae bacterium]|nr:glycosyltransferase [Lachnospiraceae bacterium]
MPALPKVNILLSTYNGEKYLAEQLDSLLAQTYENIRIYIRDDGSADDTLSIIKAYMDKRAENGGHQIILLDNSKKENLGYMKSFWTLLEKSDAADYYAFCDQDDFWLPDKIKLGVYALEKENSELPLLYSSSFIYCDENLNFKKNPVTRNTPVIFKDTMFYAPAYGFTIIINQSLKNLALSASSLENIPHDGWCQKIAASMGRLIVDPVQSAKYRRHSSTVTYTGSDKTRMIFEWIKNDILGIGLSEFRFVLQRFYDEYHNLLDETSAKCLNVFKEQRVTLSLYFKRLFYPKRLRPTLGGELALRLCFLLNR